MSKTTTKQTQQDCVLCGLVFFGNPLDMRAKNHVSPSGRWTWVCMTCRARKRSYDFELNEAAMDWMPLSQGKKCERCKSVVDSWGVATNKYRWVPGQADWDFHCLKCYLEYQRQQLAFPCSVKLLHCVECLYVIRADAAKAAGWYVLPSSDEAWCFFCKLEPDQDRVDGVPLSCTTIPQEKSRADHMGRFDYLWVVLGIQILTLAAIGLNWRFVILFLVCVSTITAIVRLFVRADQLKELLARNGVQT